MSGCRALYDRINDKFVTAKTNTPEVDRKFSGEMPPGLLLAGVYTHCIKIADLRDDMAATEDHSMEMRKVIGKHYDYIYRGIRIDPTGYSPHTVSLTLAQQHAIKKAASRRPVGQDAAPGHRRGDRDARAVEGDA